MNIHEVEVKKVIGNDNTHREKDPELVPIHGPGRGYTPGRDYYHVIDSSTFFPCDKNNHLQLESNSIVPKNYGRESRLAHRQWSTVIFRI
jgi:hypothetical protein